MPADHAVPSTTPCPRSSGREPLDAAALRQALLPPAGPWRAVTVCAETASTNADLATAAREGAAHGLVEVAEYQSAGRGRAGRHWRCPPRAGLAVSVLLRPPVPAARWGWLPLLAGVAVAEALTGHAGVAVRLKWPNDLLAVPAEPAVPADPAVAAGPAGAGKCGGILTEVVGEAVIVGVGVNVTVGAAELPPPAGEGPPPTSLALADAPVTDRGPLLTSLLEVVGWWYAAWCDAGGDPAGSGLWAAYRERSATVGSTVRVLLPGGGECTGTAEDVDADGRLVLATDAGRRVFAAGDIVHLR